MLIKKIAITGPESTGKSSLAKELAKYYQTVFVPEYAREYINKLNREYNFDDIALIAKGQIKNEDELTLNANKLLFCDTELTVTKVWSMFKYNKCDNWILDNIDKYKYDLYLLCDIDLPWEADPQREHPHLRKELFNIYCRELINRNLNFKVISGSGESRLNNAIVEINVMLRASYFVHSNS